MTNSNTKTPSPFKYARDRDGVWDTWEISGTDGEPLAFVRFWDSVEGEEKQTRDQARFIVHRLNWHDSLLSALSSLLAIFDEDTARGMPWGDSRITQARRVYAGAFTKSDQH